MKIISWNVNGLRAVLQKNNEGKREVVGGQNVLETLIADKHPDILALQETKCPENLKVDFAADQYAFQRILASQTRKGYSGVAVFSKMPPVKDWTEHFPENQEGRVICLEFEAFFFLNAYVPNSKPDLSRLDYRVGVWEKAVRDYVAQLTASKNKPIVMVADFNVAPTEIDLHNPKANMRSHGFTIEERTAFSELIESCKLVDTFRLKHPNEHKYTWFSNFANSRARNVGWRIDMALVSREMAPHVRKAEILGDFFGSDHVPIYLNLAI